MVAAALALALLVSGLVGTAVPARAIQATEAVSANPAWPGTCELDLAVSLDLSASVSDSQLRKAQDELAAFASDMADYPVRLSLHNFASNAPASDAPANRPLPLTTLDSAGIDAFTSHLRGLTRPPAGYAGTNWDRGLAALQESSENYDAALFLTDGNATQWGSPPAGPGSRIDQKTIDAAVRSANALKAKGTRVVSVGLMDNVGDMDEFRENMSQISGPARGEDYFETDFGDLRAALAEIINSDCASIGVEKSGEIEGDRAGHPGDTVKYTFAVENTGSVPLKDIQLRDELKGISDIEFSDWPSGENVLGPGEKVTASAVYTVTEDDSAAELIRNDVFVSGTPPAGEPVTGEDFVEIAVPPAQPGITLDKTAQLGEGSAGRPGDRVDYTFTLTNSGTVPLTEVGLRDELDGVSDISFSSWPGEPGRLARGETVTAQASYVLTQADIDAGEVVNHATALGSPPSGDVVSDDDSAQLPLDAEAGIALTKEASLPEGSQGVAGETVTYSFVITNSGQSTLREVELTDSFEGLSDIAFGAWPGAAGELAPGQTVTASATYTLTQQDVNSGGPSTNTAIATGNPARGDAVSARAEANLPVRGNPQIVLQKVGALAEGAGGAAGDSVDYGFEVTNTGNVTLTDVDLKDELDGLSEIEFGRWPGERGTLEPGESVNASATYSLTQDDIDAGEVRNVATAGGTVPGAGNDRVSDEDEAIVDVEPGPAIALGKTGTLVGEDSPSGTGERVRYQFTVTNTGNVTLTEVGISDGLEGLSEIEFGEWPRAEGTLKPGESVTASAEYRPSQEDIDAGRVSNEATASGRPPSGEPVTADDAHEVSIPRAPGVVLEKTGGLAEGAGASAGQGVDYGFTVRNTGNVTLSDVELSDELEGLSDIAFGDWPGQEGVLRPGESVTATAGYALSQEDIDSAVVTNVARVTANGPQGDPVAAKDSAAVDLPARPQISLHKAGSLAEDATGAAGDQVRYVFDVRNTGNVTLHDVALRDELEGLSDIAFESWPGAEHSLAPGESVRAEAEYTLSQPDVDAGEVHNEARATGTPPSSSAAPVSDRDEATVEVEPGPAMSLGKASALSDEATGASGDGVEYTFTVTNTGNVTLSGIALTDELEGLGEIEFSDWPGAEGELAPGQTVTAHSDYALTQDDVDAGAVTNTATVTGTPPSGGDVTAEDSARQPVPSAPAISVEKTAELAEGATGTAGDDLRYTFTVTNTGNVTLHGVEVSDGLQGLSEIAFEDWPGDEGRLAPGQSVVATAAYALDQADVDAGSVHNEVSVSGNPPTGPAATGTDAHDQPLVQRPAIALVKNGALEKDATGRAGDSIRYVFEITNTGNVTLSDVAVSDRLNGLSEIDYRDWPAEAGALTPGQTVTAIATYELTQDDVDAGTIVNQATATGTPPSGIDVEDDDEAPVIVPALATIELQKSGALSDDARGKAGDRVDYSFTVTNTGNVTLTGVSIEDHLDGLSAVTYERWPAQDGVLAPGQSVTATAQYRITQEDADDGRIGNRATATGSPPAGGEVTDDDAVTVPLDPGPGIDVTKTGSLPKGALSKVGDTVDYEFTVTNTGEVTLKDVALTDELEGISDLVYGHWPGTSGELAPGESITATASFVLGQDDIDSGELLNTVTGTGTPPSGARITDVDEHRQPLPSSPAITVVKSGELAADAAGRAGDAVDYVFKVTNTGNVTLSGIELADRLEGLSTPEFGDWPGAQDELRPGEMITATASYPLTQGDMDSGEILNSVTASGAPPSGDRVADQDDHRLALPGGAEIALTKSGFLSEEATGSSGDRVKYVFEVKNTGTVTLTGVTIEDELDGLSEVTFGDWPGEEGTLAPGESARAAAFYELDDEDIGRGNVLNEALAQGTPPQGDPVEATDRYELDLPDSPPPSGGGLAKTGAEIAALLAGGLLLLLIGAAVVRAARRYRQ